MEALSSARAAAAHDEQTPGRRKDGATQEELASPSRSSGGSGSPTTAALPSAPHTHTAATPSSGGENADDDENNPFSQYYGMLLHQQNMLQDHVRTSTYERAMLENSADFRDKVVLDVGTGSGILAFFALKAGAKRVYAVELSDMAHCAREIMAHNGLSDRIVVLKGKMEDVELPEPVDVVVSEPMGFFLVHERMLETYVLAAKKWRRSDAALKMFPSIGTMFVSPFTDDALYREQMAKVAFWQQRDFYGLDLSAMRARAVANHFSQPVVGYFPSDMLLAATPVAHVLDFKDITAAELHTFAIPFAFEITKTVDFIGSTTRVVLSTAPDEPGTHWYQCRLLLPTPIAVNASQSISGALHFVANKKFSYDITMEVRLDGTAIVARNVVRLHDQMYHYLYSGSSSSAGHS